MATTDYWAETPMNREQMALFAPTLDAMIAGDDPVRLFDEVLAVVDWSPWEAKYHRKLGQPPIHPRHVAAGILYGLCRGIRSTRKLEEACCYRLDFLWLLEGRRIDHSTFSRFRTNFRQPLKELFKQVGRIAMTLGLIRLGEVAFDGTRVKANNGRYATGTAKTLEEKLAALDERFEQMMEEMEAAERASDSQKTLPGQEDSPTRLPKPLAEMEKRRGQIREALRRAKAADEARGKKGCDTEKNPAQVPRTDADSRVMPNKEGGYAPNYTPIATTDGHCGFIVDAEVLGEVNEGGAAAESVDRIEATFGEKPDKFLTDAGNNSGQIIEEMENRGVEFYAPVESSQPQEGNPAKREDPRKPVPESEWPNLPRNGHGQLDKSCFVYQEAEDQYYCPQGHAMPFEENKSVQRGGVRVKLRLYRSGACEGCPLAASCLSPRSKYGRTITRDQYEEARQRTAARMGEATARALYRQRPRIAETTFGILKSVIGLRQFLLRGLAKVKTEWLWAVTAFNLGKLVRQTARLRAKFRQWAAGQEG
jgi:transposase